MKFRKFFDKPHDMNDRCRCYKDNYIHTNILYAFYNGKYKKPTQYLKTCRKYM